MHYFLLIYFNNKPLHVSSRPAAHHQEEQLCINSSWYSNLEYSKYRIFTVILTDLSTILCFDLELDDWVSRDSVVGTVTRLDAERSRKRGSISGGVTYLFTSSP